MIVASTSGNAILRHCSKLLIPGLIEYIAKLAPLVNDGSISESHSAAIGEVWKAFSAFFISIPEDQRKNSATISRTSQKLTDISRDATPRNTVANYCAPTVKLPNCSIFGGLPEHSPVVVVRYFIAISIQRCCRKVRSIHERTSRAVCEACRWRKFHVVWIAKRSQTADILAVILELRSTWMQRITCIYMHRSNIVLSFAVVTYLQLGLSGHARVNSRLAHRI